MRGRHDPQVTLLAFIDLETQVPSDHPLRVIKRLADQALKVLSPDLDIGSLVRKPGAFARYRFRAHMFPTLTFRLAYDALKRWRGERADVEYVRILHLSATTMESTVDSTLALLLEAGEPFDYGVVKELANLIPPRAPMLSLSGMPDLKVYDSLLAGVA